jgi:hypothetical protein
LQDAPAIMTDDKEAVEDAECNRWHSEEIHGHNRSSMVSQEVLPRLLGNFIVFHEPKTWLQHPMGNRGMLCESARSRFHRRRMKL